jgi:hypothetical protein
VLAQRVAGLREALVDDAAHLVVDGVEQGVGSSRAARVSRCGQDRDRADPVGRPPRPTIARAVRVLVSRSCSEPVVTTPKTTSSAAIPPSAPNARPRGMIETLRAGSAPGWSMPGSACPASW